MYGTGRFIVRNNQGFFRRFSSKGAGENRINRAANNKIIDTRALRALTGPGGQSGILAAEVRFWLTGGRKWLKLPVLRFGKGL